MVIAKVCVLIDGGFFETLFKKNHEGTPPTPEDVVDEVRYTMDAIRSKTREDSDEIEDVLFRVFYYDCLPFGGNVAKIGGGRKDFSLTQSYADKREFLNELYKRDRFVLRLGQLSFTGWEPQIDKMQPTMPVVGYRPIFKQKGVDMKFGLDMAQIATKHVVDKVALIAGDSDFITPIKFAKKEGLQVYLNHMGNNVRDDLIQHCDFVLQ